MNKKLLKSLLETTSPSGYEGRGALDAVLEYYPEMGQYLHSTDNIGNVIFKIGEDAPGKKSIMLSGHIDEIGLQVTGFTEHGLVRFTKIGGLDRKVLEGSLVRLISSKNNIGDIIGVVGKKAIHVESLDEREKVSKFEDMLVDIGVESKEEAMKLLEIGDIGVQEVSPIMEFGKNRIAGKALDDKLGTFCAIEAVQKLILRKDILDNFVIYLVLASQEEVGLRGATVVANALNVDISIDLDVTVATDDDRDGSLAVKYGDAELGEGVVLTRNVNNSERIVRIMRSCKELYQLSAGGPGGTNTSEIQLSGTETALISIPVRNLHTAYEVADYRDIKSAINILVKTISKLC